MNEKSKKGFFITIEGVEGVGKSTAIHFLKQHFLNLNIDYIVTREPGGTEIAEEIRQVLLHKHNEKMCADTELLLMFASRAQHLDQVVKPALSAGKVVLSDRFTDATYAYQGGGRGINSDRIAILEEWVQGQLQPDLTILLDAPVEVGLKRIASRGVKDRIEHEQMEFFQKVREAYLGRASQHPERFKIIDATQSLTTVQEMLCQILEKLNTRV